MFLQLKFILNPCEHFPKSKKIMIIHKCYLIQVCFKQHPLRDGEKLVGGDIGPHHHGQHSQQLLVKFSLSPVLNIRTSLDMQPSPSRSYMEKANLNFSVLDWSFLVSDSFWPFLTGWNRASSLKKPRKSTYLKYQQFTQTSKLKCDTAPNLPHWYFPRCRMREQFCPQED